MFKRYEEFTKAELIESRLIERLYIYVSVFLLFWFLFLLDYRGGHGPDPVEYFFFFVNIGFIILGIPLVVGAWKRKPIFWILLGATLLSCSYIGVPFLMGL